MLNCDVTFERKIAPLLSLSNETNKTSWNRRYFAENNQDEPNHFSPFLNSKPIIVLKFVCLTPYTPHCILQRCFAQQSQRTSKLLLSILGAATYISSAFVTQNCVISLQTNVKRYTKQSTQQKVNRKMEYIHSLLWRYIR